MRNFLKKLRSTAGETLVESMASVLIFTLSSIILLSMVASASRLNRIAKEEDNALTHQLYIAEAQSAGAGTTTSEDDITVSFTINSTYHEQDIHVTFYSAGENCLYSFAERVS